MPGRQQVLGYWEKIQLTMHGLTTVSTGNAEIKSKVAATKKIHLLST